MDNSVSPIPPVDILVVEDNEIDVEAVERAFKKAHLNSFLHKACDGVEALDMLKGRDGKDKVPQPSLILLDLNMPRMGGIQLLKELRSDQTLKHTIVFVLTTSSRSADRILAYEHNVAGYFLKGNLDRLVDTLTTYCKGNEFPSGNDR